MMSKVLIAGATGYIGSKLLRNLDHGGYAIRCGARIPEFLKSRVPEHVEVIPLDCTIPDTLKNATQGIESAFYLVHSLGANQGSQFESIEYDCARNFAEVAAQNRVKKIIYLGGLGDASTQLSPHLRSRQKVGEILASTGVPVIEFRASIILGAGSLSFELVRALCERLPVMICPKWVKSEAQPIGVWSVLQYLEQALKYDSKNHEIFEIGGSQVVSYLQIMQEYSRLRGLPRRFIPVPFLTPTISSLWLGLVTPLYSRVGRKLIDSLKNPTIVTDKSARLKFPSVEVEDLNTALTKTIAHEERESRQVRWSDAIGSKGLRRKWAGVRFGNRIVDSHSLEIKAKDPSIAFAPIRRIGGRNGWYYADFLWKLRGFLDLMVGGVGIRRGRPDPEQLAVGDTVDWWRVEAYEPDQLLRLYAEMKTPGRAWLEFRVRELAPGRYRITQNAIFDPIGLVGLLYWYSLYPLHGIIFKGMLRSMRSQIKEIDHE
tara:strand:+ start:1214 stop:2674 length:1461 start_codon:yes stop_codon:yes gene_type:complete